MSKPLRLWPGVLFGTLIPIFWFGVPLVAPGTPYGVLGGALCSLIVIVWWTFFSRAPRGERWGAIPVIAVALTVTFLLVDVSISNGAMGALLFMLAIPTIAVAIPVWAVATRQAASGTRRISMVVAIVLACGLWTLARTDGMMGDGPAMLRWRWTPTAEERLLAQGDDLPQAPPAAAALVVSTPAPVAPPESPVAPVDTPLTVAPEAGHTHGEHEHASRPAAVVAWPGFRGSHRNSVITGVRINTNWTQSPPAELWRRPIGPGWSSFAVGSDLIYTQEQRGDEEIVAAYRITSGEPVWAHRDTARFWESNGGAGPRGTPTLHEGRIYALGATGIVNVLDAASGAVVWSHNVGQDTNVSVPMWGFSASPLIVGDVVVVAAAGTLAGYDRATGALRWTGPRYIGDGYSSPHLATIDSVTQVLMLSLAGTTSVAPEDGKVLWEYAWPAMGGPIVQPSVTAEGDVLVTGLVGISGGELRRVAAARDRGEWKVTERWRTSGLKPYFNDYVLHKGHAYGFDGSILACVDLADGVRKWKGGRYGAGQLVLLADQDLLLVISEEGELALVSATPEGFQAIARVPGIEGKTWNHPVLVGDVLLVRNGEEMAAFKLATAQ